MINNKDYYRKIREIEQVQDNSISILDVRYKHSPIYMLKDSKIDYASYITHYEHSSFGVLFLHSENPFQIENVYQYHLFVIASDNKILPVFPQRHILEISDLKDFYIVCTHPKATKHPGYGVDEVILCDLNIYHLNVLQKTLYNVQRIDKIGADLKIIYTSQKNKDTYQHWIYKNKISELVLEDTLSWLSYSQNALLIERTAPEISHNSEFVEIIFSDSMRKNCLILKEFAKTVQSFNILPNLFFDDDTINYKIEISKNNIVDIAFAKYCLDCDMATGSYLIYGVPLEFLEKFYQTEPSPQRAVNEVNKLNLTIEQEQYYQELALSVLETLLAKNVSSNEMAYIKNTGAAQSSALLSFLQLQNFKYVSYINKLKERYDQFYSILIDNGVIITKWKSEYSLYELIRKKYPNAIYQYRAKWLSHQSLDIYIPDKRIGIEYQGIQHYKPVSLFGGLPHFRLQQELDNRKRKLCSEQGIRLIEWRYDEPISSDMLKKKL